MFLSARTGLFVFILYNAAHASVLWTEHFEEPFPPNEWIEYSVDPSSSYAFDGTLSAKLSASGDYLITPHLTTGNTLIFWTYTTAADPDIIVEYSDSQNGPWIETPESPFSGYTGQWNGQSIDLSSLQNPYIKFRKNGTGSLYIDSVSLEQNDLTAHRPPVITAPEKLTVLEGESLTFNITAEDPADQDACSLSVSGLPSESVFTNSVFTWSSAAPDGVYTLVITASDKDGETKQTVKITVGKRPQVFISEIADPAGTGGGDFRFIELYNAGSTPICFEESNWTLSRQINGTATWDDTALTGTISPGKTWIIAYSETDFQTAYGVEPDMCSPTVSGNGDDAYSLYIHGDHQNGVLIDRYGEIDTDGTGTAWDYTDSRAVRRDQLSVPNPIWTSEEWVIEQDAAVRVMTPGKHGPLPEFPDITNPFVFLGDDLNLQITAVSKSKTDPITLAVESLPAGAVFSDKTEIHSVSEILHWTKPAAGNYTAVFTASNNAGISTKTLFITVSATDQIDGYFHGWANDTIIKLQNGQYWRNTGGIGPTVNPAQFNPFVSLTNRFGEHRIVIEGVTGYTTIREVDITASTVKNAFAGLHYENSYQLNNETVWKQISFENIPSSAYPVTTWLWNENDHTFIRFLNWEDITIGTCEVIPADPPEPAATADRIIGWFSGFGYHHIFRLENRGWRRQFSFEKTTTLRENPDVLIREESGFHYLNMPSEKPEVCIEPLDILHEGTVTNTFTGLHYGNIYQMDNGKSYLQVSFENTNNPQENPMYILWIEEDLLRLYIYREDGRPEGTCAVIDTALDSDGDKISNSSEFIAGSDLQDPTSFFRLAEPIILEDGSLCLSWESVEDRSYNILWTPALDIPFHSAATVEFPQNSWTNNSHTAERAGFYRVEVQLTP